MYTLEQLEEIKRRLKLGGMKDSELPSSSSLTGDELVPIVQSGKNVITSISDILNMDGNAIYPIQILGITLTKAIELLPKRKRQLGAIITFQSPTGDWEVYQYSGSKINEFSNESYWKPFFRGGNSYRGHFQSEEALKNSVLPTVGDYAFVGKVIEESEIYVCKNRGEWVNTKLGVFNHIEGIIKSVEEDTGIDIHPETLVDRSIADAEGNVIHTTYLSRDSAAYLIKKEVKNAEGKLEVPDGSITIDKLSESAKVKLGTPANITPDDEDLTLKSNGTIKFADREYNKYQYSGYGRKILRKNITSGVNLLEECVLKEANTIYEVRYDYDLNGNTITLPKNVVLDFTYGGSFRNGKIVADGATILTLNKEQQFAVDIEGEHLFLFDGKGSTTIIKTVIPKISVSPDGYLVIDGKKTDALVKGDKGDRGEAGAAGSKGDKGAKGDAGVAGPKGKDGTDGKTPFFFVEGNKLYWRYNTDPNTVKNLIWDFTAQNPGTPVPDYKFEFVAGTGYALSNGNKTATINYDAIPSEGLNLTLTAAGSISNTPNIVTVSGNTVNVDIPDILFDNPTGTYKVYDSKNNELTIIVNGLPEKSSCLELMRKVKAGFTDIGVVKVSNYSPLEGNTISYDLDKLKVIYDLIGDFSITKSHTGGANVDLTEYSLDNGQGFNQEPALTYNKLKNAQSRLGYRILDLEGGKHTQFKAQGSIYTITIKPLVNDKAVHPDRKGNCFNSNTPVFTFDMKLKYHDTTASASNIGTLDNGSTYYTEINVNPKARPNDFDDDPLPAKTVQPTLVELHYYNNVHDNTDGNTVYYTRMLVPAVKCDLAGITDKLNAVEVEYNGKTYNLSTELSGNPSYMAYLGGDLKTSYPNDFKYQLGNEYYMGYLISGDAPGIAADTKSIPVTVGTMDEAHLLAHARQNKQSYVRKDILLRYNERGKILTSRLDSNQYEVVSIVFRAWPLGGNIVKI